MPARPIHMPLTDECWVLTTGEAGMRSQALGLAGAVGLPIVEKRVVLKAPWSWLPGGLVPLPLAALDPAGDPIAPPWPRLVVACGRRSIGVALAVKRLSGGRSFAAYVQNPELAGKRFDLVAAMPHDGVSAPNVVTVPTALHPVTPARLAAAAEAWRARLMPEGKPMLGVLLGGDNASYRLTPAVMARLLRVLRSAHAAHGLEAVATPSRRTPDHARHLLSRSIEAEHWGSWWNGDGPNPYRGILALSERLIVTSESISMISEALATGRPVHVLPLEGRGRRHDAFLRRIVGEGLVSMIEGDDLDWDFAGVPPLDSTEIPAAEIRRRLGL
jgi:mitochondrial fission protein ELM1